MVALADISIQLRALRELAGQDEPDQAKAHLLLHGLVDRFTDLASNAQALMGSLQRAIDLHDADFDPRRARYPEAAASVRGTHAGLR